jgi:hypothetical protein
VTDNEYQLQQLDDFAAAGGSAAEELKRQFVDHFYFGAEADFRQSTFENAARLHTALNPDFFKGTVVEGAVATLK